MPQDVDRVETQEWVDALDSVLEFEGAERASFLLDELVGQALRSRASVPYTGCTPYVNSTPVNWRPAHPGDLGVERRIRSPTRWNAVAMVLRANKESSELGGHCDHTQRARTSPNRAGSGGDRRGASAPRAHAATRAGLTVRS
jgi:pyruvate dehydrogenase E1 component